jgi:hypothetical protein
MGKGSKARPLSVSKADFDDKFTGIFGNYVPPYLRNRTEETMQVRVQENPEDIGKCGCGRSPTGKCIGWHGLSQEAFEARLAEYQAQAEAAAK